MNRLMKISFLFMVVLILFFANLLSASMLATIPGQSYANWVEQKRKQAAKECPVYKNLDQKGKWQIGSAYNLSIVNNMGMHLPPEESTVLKEVYKKKVEAENRLKASGEIKKRPNQSISVTDYIPNFNFFEYCNCVEGDVVNSITEALYNSNGTDGVKADMNHKERCLIKEAKR
jgi:hypothetical protein